MGNAHGSAAGQPSHSPGYGILGAGSGRRKSLLLRRDRPSRRCDDVQSGRLCVSLS